MQAFYDIRMTHREDSINCEGLYSIPLRLCRSIIQFSAGVKVLENDENYDDIHITAAVDCGGSHWEDCASEQELVP